MRVLKPDFTLPELKPVSIFLAGPTPRSELVSSWRPDALATLEELEFGGDVLVPEPFVGEFDAQVGWELHGLDTCGAICFWVPRDLETLPGFTTNVEFGRYVDSGRAFYGRPSRAPKTRYLDRLYQEATGRIPWSNLAELLAAAVSSFGSQ